MSWFVAYLILCMVTGAVMTATGFGPDTLQYWVICLCQIFSYIFGRAYEDSMR